MCSKYFIYSFFNLSLFLVLTVLVARARETEKDRRQRKKCREQKISRYYGHETPVKYHRFNVVIERMIIG